MDNEAALNGELADDPMRRMCSNCGARITHTHTQWANQHGIRERFFCDVCGMWEDRRLLYKPLSLWVRTVHESIPLAEVAALVMKG